METLIAVTPATLTLPPDLALLDAPVRAAEPSAPDEHVGRAEGALLDDKGRVVAFVVRLSPRLAPRRPRVLVSSPAVSVTDGPVLHVSWTENQLLSLPRLDENLRPHDRVNGGPPMESEWMPARPNRMPAEGAANTREAIKEGVEGGAAGAVIGAVAGLAVAGPVGALALGGFLAAGGALAGAISGVTHETAVEAGEMKFNNITPEQGDGASSAIRLLEARLRDPATTLQGLVHMTRLSPLS